MYLAIALAIGTALADGPTVLTSNADIPKSLQSSLTYDPKTRTVTAVGGAKLSKAPTRGYTVSGTAVTLDCSCQDGAGSCTLAVKDDALTCSGDPCCKCTMTLPVNPRD